MKNIITFMREGLILFVRWILIIVVFLMFLPWLISVPFDNYGPMLGKIFFCSALLLGCFGIVIKGKIKKHPGLSIITLVIYAVNIGQAVSWVGGPMLTGGVIVFFIFVSIILGAVLGTISAYIWKVKAGYFHVALIPAFAIAVFISWFFIGVVVMSEIRNIKFKIEAPLRMECRDMAIKLLEEKKLTHPDEETFFENCLTSGGVLPISNPLRQ